MHPGISIGFYAALQLLTILFIDWLILRGPYFSRHTKLRRVMAAALSVICVILSILPVAGTLLKDSPLKFTCQGAGNIWLGFLFYFYGIFITGILCILIFGLITILSGHPRHILPLMLPAALISVCGSLILLVYGLHHAQQTIVTDYDVTISKPGALPGDLKVVLIGDLHLSVNSNPQMIRNMVDEINRQNADMVLVAGDIFTSSYKALKDPDRYSAILSEIRSEYGTFAVYGNHDVEEDLFGGFPISPISEAFRSESMEQFFKDCHFTVLADETVSLADGSLILAGRVDGEKAGDGTAIRETPAQLLEEADTNKPVIVLEHEPVEFEALKESGADLALSGHTHAGQMFPGNLIVPFFNENAYGYKVVSGLQSIVTSGIGYYGPPMRVGTNSEIAVLNIHLRSADSR